MPPKAAPAKGKGAPAKQAAKPVPESETPPTPTIVDDGAEDVILPSSPETPGKKAPPKAEIPVPRDDEGWAKFQQHFKCSADMMKELEDTFKLLDTDGSGALEEQEVFDGLEALGCPATMEEVRAMIAASDFDGNGQVDYAEFCLMIATKHKADKEKKKAMARGSSLHPSLTDADDLLAQIMATIGDAEYMLQHKKKAAKKTVGLWRL